jgi:hypothetical protein
MEQKRILSTQFKPVLVSHQACYPVGVKCSDLGIKRSEREAETSFPTNAKKFKN